MTVEQYRSKIVTAIAARAVAAMSHREPAIVAGLEQGAMELRGSLEAAGCPLPPLYGDLDDAAWGVIVGASWALELVVNHATGHPHRDADHAAGCLVMQASAAQAQLLLAIGATFGFGDDAAESLADSRRRHFEALRADEIARSIEENES